MLSCYHSDFNVYIKERKIVIQVDKVVLGEESKIDGCYVLTTDLKKEMYPPSQFESTEILAPLIKKFGKISL